MQPWRHESLFADYITEHTPMPSRHFMNPVGTAMTQEARRNHLNTLSDIHASLRRLQPYLSRNDQETKWVDQLKGYLDRLRASTQPQTPEEQFNQLYALRKWLFWVPISLLAAKRGDVNVLVILAHFYAVALALEPMFPDVASVFVADLSLRPLEEVVQQVQGRQDPAYNSRMQAMSYLVQFPMDMLSAYKQRKEWARQQTPEGTPVQQPAYALETVNLDLDNQLTQFNFGQNLSPAFAPSPLTFMPSGMSNTPSSPYLEIPRTTVDAYGTSSYTSSNLTTTYASPMASPAAVLPPYSAPQEHGFNFGMPTGYPGGFVATPIWT